MKRLPLILIAGLAMAQAGFGQTRLEDPASLDMEVARFTGKAIGEIGGATHHVDTRLHLSACPKPHTLSWYGSSQSAVEINCPENGSWRVYVAILKTESRQAAPQPDAIVRGDIISITVIGEGFAITRQGEAMENGAKDSWIRVKTDAKGSVVRAKIIGPGEVGIELP